MPADLLSVHFSPIKPRARTIRLHSASPALAAFTQSALHRHGEGRFLAHVACADGPAPEVRLVLESAGYLRRDAPPWNSLSRYDEEVAILESGSRVAPATIPRIQRTLHLPEFGRASEFFSVHRKLRRELRDHFRVEMPDLRPPPDSWEQDVHVGGPRSRGRAMHRVRFRARVLASGVEELEEGRRRTLTVYQFEDETVRVHERLSCQYLPEESVSAFVEE